MAESRIYSVRPFSKPARSDMRDVFRAYLSPATLLSHKLHSGDVLLIKTANETSVAVIAWAAQEKIQDNIIQISRQLQILHNIKLSDRVTIKGADVPILDAETVLITEVTPDDTERSIYMNDKAEREQWQWYLNLSLRKAGVIGTGVMFEIDLDGKRVFKVMNINDSIGSKLYQFVPQSKAYIASNKPPEELIRELKITRDSIGGLTKQLDKLDEKLAAFGDGLENIKFPTYYRPRRGGTLLHGSSGTGKSLMLLKLASAGWRSVRSLDTVTMGQQSVQSVTATIVKMYEEAKRDQPSVFIIDDLEVVAGKSHEGLRAVFIAETFRRLFKESKGVKVLVIATVKKLSDLHERFRSVGCFGTQIEIPVPDAGARSEILKVHCGLLKDSRSERLDRLAERTHGYVGADLDDLVQLAVQKSEKRALTARTLQGKDEEVGEDRKHKPEDIIVQVNESDLNEALLETRPTAMQEVFLEPPKVRWTDIGGQQEVKKSLKQAVIWPFKYPHEMIRLGIQPKKGLLLYGPPGCSKTLTAKAVATEAGLNFLAVKGAELLSMYVGESERAMRDIFQKARNASPSIIFFDEIDAIGASRDADRQGSGLNVLTTLLNELDGIEELKGVFVLAATNKPEVLDPALMRPGRLDTRLYVGPPDHEARVEILQISIRKMDVCEDVNAQWLAEKTDGYTGAELVSICQKAGFAALEDQEQTGETQKISCRHFEVALAEIERQVTPEMRARYEQWRS